MLFLNSSYSSNLLFELHVRVVFLGKMIRVIDFDRARKFRSVIIFCGADTAESGLFSVLVHRITV